MRLDGQAIHCPACGRPVGEMRAGELVCHHDRRTFVAPRALTCKCGGAWFVANIAGTLPQLMHTPP
jgi:hypothetical protein